MERIFKDEELKREIDDVVKTVALEFKTKFTEFQTKVSDVNDLIAKLDNKNEETSIRISDIDLKINTKINTDIDELKRKLKL